MELDMGGGDPTLLDIVVGHVKSGRGRQAAPLELSVVRELEPNDLALINNPPAHGVTTAPLVKLRHVHHQLARLLAEGTRPHEASAITGYSPSRISILQNDPAFKELLAYYKQQAEAKFLDVHERLAMVGTTALEVIQERLEEPEEGEKFSNSQLMALVELAYDRSVAPSKSGKGMVPAGMAPPPPQINIQFISPSNRPGAQTQTVNATALELEPME